jgi:hypothetical protein
VNAFNDLLLCKHPAHRFNLPRPLFLPVLLLQQLLPLKALLLRETLTL